MTLRSILILCSISFHSYINGQEQTLGLFQNGENAFNGYTLLSNNEWSYLIDNCGNIVNEWESTHKTGHGIYLTPEGDLLRAGAISGDYDAGGLGGIFELYDWNGDLKWQYQIASADQHAHHDIALLPNGNFLCTVWERKSEAEATSNGRIFNGEVWSESILEIEILENNSANIVWEWSVWDHLIQDKESTVINYGIISEHPELLDINYIGQGQNTSGNWLHINALSYNAELDQIVFSSRYLSEIYVIDHSTTTAEAASHSGGQYGRGGDILFRFGNPQVYDQGDESDQILRGQHNIDWVKNGTEWIDAFSVFDNEYLEGAQSRAIIFNNPIDDTGNYSFDPTNKFGDVSILRSYTNTTMHSDILSGVQVLPNNNLLILEGRSGHIFEIDDDDNVVWDYIYPVNRNGSPGIQGGEPRFNLLFRALRYSPDYEGFADRQLSPLEPIELSPFDSNCEIFGGSSPVTGLEESNESAYRLLGNPIKNVLAVRVQVQLQGFIIDAFGRKIREIALHPGLNEIDFRDVPSGIYVLNTPKLSFRFLKL